MVLRNTGLENWVISELATGKVNWISMDYIVRNVPQSLVNQIPNTQQLMELLHYMEFEQGFLIHNYDRFSLTTDGLLQFRKNLDPLWQIANDKKRFSRIIEGTEGDTKTKKEYKKFLEKIRSKPQDEFTSELIDYLKKTGKEALFYTLRLLLENPN